MFTDQNDEQKMYAVNPGYSVSVEDGQYDGAGALLNMLAEVASQTLHSDPSVRISVKESTDNDHLIKKRKRAVCRSRMGEHDRMDLEQICTLSANHLIKLFSEFDGDEMRRTFHYTCFMEPEHCNKQFSSFGSEGKARQQMKSHLLEHVKQLQLNAACGAKFAVEPVKIRRRRIEQVFNTNKRKKLLSKLSPTSVMKEESNENDSNIPNKENQKCPNENQLIIMNTLEDHSKLEKIKFNNKENANLTEYNTKCEDFNEKQSLNTHLYPQESLSREAKSNKEGTLKHKIYEEHSYTAFGIEIQNSRPLLDNAELNCKTNKMEVPISKLLPGDIFLEESPAEDLSRFMVTETLQDTVMVCVMEDNQLQLKQLPCVGQEVDVDTSQLSPCKTVKADPVSVLENKPMEPQICSLDTISDMNSESNIERDEFRYKKKPKGKAKFIGQSKAEKEMAIQLIDIMKRKGSSMESLECHICNPPRTFTAPTTLISHYRSHAGIKPYECRICRSVFTRQHSLNYHMLIHSNQTRFTCGDCGRKFRHPSHFKEHRRRHTGESPFECSDCMLRFKTRNTYKRHLKTRHGKVLTTSGNLIVLTEEEFSLVRTLPRPHQNTDLNVDEKIEKKAVRKGKGDLKSITKRRQKSTSEIKEQEIQYEVEEDYSDTNTIESSESIIAKSKLLKKKNFTKPFSRSISDAVGTSELPLDKSNAESQHFQDIVERAMRQSDITFQGSECDNVNTTAESELSTLKAVSVFAESKVDGKEHIVNNFIAPKINIKSSWNTVNVQLKNTDNVKLSVNEMSLPKKDKTKCITQLLPKPLQSETLKLQNSVGFSPVVINRSDMANVVPNSTKFTETLAFLRPRYSVIDNNEYQQRFNGVNNDFIGIVGKDGVNLIGTEPQQTTVMLLANSYEISSQQNFIFENICEINGPPASIPQMCSNSS